MNNELNRGETSGDTLRILVADDHPDVLKALRMLLKGAGYKLEVVDTPKALLQAATGNAFDLILMDLNYTRDTTSGTEGLALLDRLNEQEPSTPVIAMTAWGSIDLAVEAMRHGADDFIQKPWDNNQLLYTLGKQAREAATRRKAEACARRELDIARNVQQKLFPQRTRTLESASYSGRSIPAREVGGDYYDFLDLGSGLMGMVLADVSGKGIAAGLLMANLQGCFRSRVERWRSTSAILEEVNRLFFASTPPEQYTTAFCAQYDDRNQWLRYVNCGHLPPVLARANGGIDRLNNSATPLGMFSDWSGTETVVDLEPGDTLILFSDGITESGIDSGIEFGEDRMIEMIDKGRHQPLDDLVNGIVDAAHEYSMTGQTDDMTVVGLRIK